MYLMKDIQQHFRDISYLIANHLGITIHENSSTTEHGTANKVLINKGELLTHPGVSWSLAIHELLHIAVVEKQYRYLMNKDTQEGYSAVNAIEPTRKKYRSESATLGLQYHVYDHFDLIGYLGGNFFSGNIRKRDGSSCIPKMWITKGKDLFDELGLKHLTI